MKAWLKGGLIGLVINIILGLLTFVTPQNYFLKKIIEYPVWLGFEICLAVSNCSGLGCLGCLIQNIFYVLILKKTIY